MPYLDPNNDAFTLNDYTLPWQMSRWEKYTFYTLLESIKPECAIEIGTYKGGSLQVISDFSRHVYSIDIDSELSLSAQKGFTNTEFLWGKSREILPELLERIAESGEKLNFVLVDGEHTPEGVKSDIEMILQYKP
ncbi:MAG: class I SAM-dependent methyltransferase, partial [Bacteroidota bacterium]